MRLRGATRGRAFTITTRRDEAAAWPVDLVQRTLTATRPNQLWVADLPYVATWRGFVYVAFVRRLLAAHRRLARRHDAALGSRT